MQSSTPLKYKLVFPMRAVCVHGCMHECMYVLVVDESHVSPAFVHWFNCFLFLFFPVPVSPFQSDSVSFFSFFSVLMWGFQNLLKNSSLARPLDAFHSSVNTMQGYGMQNPRTPVVCTNYRGDRIVNGSGDRK